MHVEIENEAAQFHFMEYLFRIFGTVHLQCSTFWLCSLTTVTFLSRKNMPPPPLPISALKHPQTITEVGCLTVLAVYFVSNLLEPERQLTILLMFLMQRKVDSSEYMTLDQLLGAQ
jgi:hypothetical protein